LKNGVNTTSARPRAFQFSILNSQFAPPGTNPHAALLPPR
jgi:hypothetical protein